MPIAGRQTAHSAMPCSGSGVPAAEVPEVWKEASVLLEPAVNRSLGRYDLNSLHAALLHREMQLWCVWDRVMIAAVLTQMNVWPTGMKTARVVMAGGMYMKKWTHMMDLIEQWAKANGCKYLEAGGRPGWKKVLGWKQTAVELVKDLSDA